MSETANSMSSILEQASTLFTWVMANLATIVTTIAGSPLLILGFLLSLIGFCVGIVKRLMNLG